MTTPFIQTQSASPQPQERWFAAGVIEKRFPAGPESACVARPGLIKATYGQRTGDDGYYLARGLAANALMNIVSEQFTTDGTMLIDLAGTLDEILAGRDYRRFAPEVIARIHPEIVQMVRGWQARVGQEDDLDLSGAVRLLKPEHDLFVRRPGRFRIRVRPDHVVAVGDVTVGGTIVALEWSTSKNPDTISPARFALNWHALFRERLRHPEWEQYTSIVTRVEMLALGYGFTVRLATDDLEQWRLAIGTAVEGLIAGDVSKNIGPWCSTCPAQAACWFDGEEDGDARF